MISIADLSAARSQEPNFMLHKSKSRELYETIRFSLLLHYNFSLLFP